jgi:hypothetical protein
MPTLPRFTRFLLGVLGALLLALGALTFSVQQSQAPRLEQHVQEYAQFATTPDQQAHLQEARRQLAGWQLADARRWHPNGYGFNTALWCALGVGLLFLAIRARTA